MVSDAKQITFVYMRITFRFHFSLISAPTLTIGFCNLPFVLGNCLRIFWLKMEGESNQIGERKKRIAVGPWGGNGGSAWDDSSYNGVREITLVHARCIDSIKVVYDKNGKPLMGEKHGGVGGIRTSEIKLQFPDEYLISVSGHISPVVHGGSPVIRSLTFKSNRRTFGPYGVEEGTPFSLPIEGGQIVGFKGRGGWYLDAIGCHLSRVQPGRVFQNFTQRLKRLTSAVAYVPKDGNEKGVKAVY